VKRLLFIFLLLAPTLVQAAQPEAGMVVAAEPLAAQAGAAMLHKGGNAFDAAAATALALGVVEPGSSGIGGGGFFLLYIAKDNRYVMIDARETSPRAAGFGDVYEKQSSIDGVQAAGVPGLVAGIGLLEKRYGRLTFMKTSAPAIRLARNGFVVGPRLGRMIEWRGKVFNDAAKAVFLKNEGENIRQLGLADTLERLAKRGADDFYTGETALRLVRDIRHAGGLISLRDLAGYHAVERKPVMFDYHGFRFISAALPSSGGMTLAHILGQLKEDDLGKLSEADRDHLLIEAMKRAYRDRNRYLGDSDFVPIPRDYLDPARLAGLRHGIDMHRATPSLDLQGVGEMHQESHNTTHFSIIDRDGNMVAATLSINYGFGSGYMSPSTGVLLNDEMDDFATRPGEPNVYGLVQGKANGVEPGKRMLSSMTPTFVVGPHRTFILGTPGGSRIISMVLEASVGFMLDKGQPQQWVDAPRFHHQFLPDEVQVEPDFPKGLAAALAKREQHIKRLKRAWGNMQAIVWNRDSGKLTGIADRRGEGQALATSLSP
jgi:gamma-glutamyltranspeptidase / glutathione hydrolase